MNNLLKNKYVLVGLALIIGLGIGYIIKPDATATNETAEHSHAEEASVYTCSMHPQIRQNEPGQCPICGMDLVPVEDEEEGIDPKAVSMSESAMILAGVNTSKVGLDTKSKTLTLQGKIQPDEAMIVSQATHIPGRVEALYVDFTGEYVKRGQVVARVYSPELVTAQQELFTAKKYEDSQPALLKSAKAKLKNWKLSESQIENILKTGEPINNFPITADVSGYVVGKNVNLGDYLNKGQSLYKIADLSKVWVLFDLYEQDLMWVETGDQVKFTVASIPGETFENTIEFIDPVIDPVTRVAKARVEMKNPDLRFKPEMFVNGKVESGIGLNEGKITIPKSAVMWTGERSVVYVKTITDQGVSFMMREIVLGPSLGKSYVVKEGLKQGEEIATSGTFSIDAAAQLAGKPSMMSPEGGSAPSAHQHGEVSGQTVSSNELDIKSFEAPKEFKEQLKSVYNAYLPMKDALVASDAQAAAKSASKISSSLQKVDMSLVKGEAHTYWMKLLNPMKNASESIQTSDNLETQRQSLIPLTNNLVAAIKSYNVNGLNGFYQYCPMADNNKGAYWLSNEDDVKNPYFGDAMLTCGEVVETIGN